jgi:large subunit ribosomal protein L21
VLTLPTLKPAQAPGTSLQLTRILEVGSREFAIRSEAARGKELRKEMPNVPGVDASFETIPPHVARCELTVLEHTKSPLTRTVLTKRRKGYRKTIQNKQGWTRLRVGDIILGDGKSA